ncbi:MAG: hypothetical protein UT60_C0035G0007 [candidate division CPR2 bacterium GW2011_GWD2_39_7]|nr:MAG: hypothetical protein UT60_C0035G0007 [candidate division CPR2 bacterium GW2011_GWD2_39_7]
MVHRSYYPAFFHSNIPFQINGESLKKQINNGDIIEISIVGEELVFVVFGIQIIHTYPHILRIHQGFFPNGNPKPLIPKNPKQEKPLKAIITVKTRATPNPGF